VDFLSLDTSAKLIKPFGYSGPPSSAIDRQQREAATSVRSNARLKKRNNWRSIVSPFWMSSLILVKNSNACRSKKPSSD
jgi:hypothetical protein